MSDEIKIKPTLHFAMMCNRSNGGYASGLSLIDALKDCFEVTPWSLYGDLYPGHEEDFQSRGLCLRRANPAITISPGDHVFFYMNEYPTVFSNYSKQWQLALEYAATVQIAFNRTLGRLPLEVWLAQKVSTLYFQDLSMLTQWRALVASNALSSIEAEVFAPPVNVQPYLQVTRAHEAPLVIGRLAGDGAVPHNSAEVYLQLSSTLPDAEFWFMPAPESLRSSLESHPQFRFFEPNEISVIDFFTSCGIYMLTYQDGIPIPGPRSLVEAMASGCAPVVVNRDGPKQRVVHGESGYCANNNSEFLEYVTMLATNKKLRIKIGEAARQRSRGFTPQSWVDKIFKTIHSKN